MAIRMPSNPYIRPPSGAFWGSMGDQLKAEFLGAVNEPVVTRTVRSTPTATAPASSGGSSGGGSYSGGTTTRRTSSGGGGGGGGGGGAVSSANWTCPAGATLTNESNGSGNLVCRWNHNGVEFAAIPAASPVAVTPKPPVTTPTTPAPVTPAPVPTPPVVAPVVTAPKTAAEYLETAADVFAAEPQSMLAGLLRDKYGANTNNQLYHGLEPYAENANAIYLAQMGKDAAAMEGDAFTPYLENYFNTLQTPGQRINYDAAIGNIFDMGTDNPLAAYLSEEDPTDQTSNALRLLGAAVDGKYHPLAEQAIMKQLDMARQRYIFDSQKNAAIGNFIEYVRKNNPSLVAQLLR